jgi:hypothetical protein
MAYCLNPISLLLHICKILFETIFPSTLTKAKITPFVAESKFLFEGFASSTLSDRLELQIVSRVNLKEVWKPLKPYLSEILV